MKAPLLSTARKVLKNASKLTDVNNWFYHHPKFLNQLGIITGDVAVRELKAVAENKLKLVIMLVLWQL